MRSAQKSALAGLLAALLALAGCTVHEEPQASETLPPGQRIDPLPAGKYLYLAGDRHLTIVDVDAAASWVARRPRLAPGGAPFRLLRRGGRLVYYGPGGVIYSTDLHLLQRPRRLGGFYFLPSADRHRIWLADFDQKSPRGRWFAGAPNGPAFKDVREVTPTGRVTFRAVRPPGGYWPLVALRAGLGIGSLRGFGLDIWNPRARLVTTTLSTAITGPAYENLLVRSSHPAGRIHITDVVSGRDRAVIPPHGYPSFDASVGEFSPDGRWLAVPIAKAPAIYAGRALALIDVASGRLRFVPGSKVSAGAGYVTWASDGRTVFMSRGGSASSLREVVVYRLGDRRADKIPVKVGPFYGMAAS